MLRKTARSMDHVFIGWFVAISCIAGLRIAWIRRRNAGVGWVVLLGFVLLIDIAGWFFGKKPLIYVAGLTWLLLVFVPGLLAALCHRRLLQQRFAEARQLARVISWLHPVDGWREQPEIIHAMALADANDISAASEVLNRYRTSNSPMTMVAMPILYRITNDWEGFIGWEKDHREEVERDPQLLPALLRARGETGDWQGLFDLYERRRSEVQRLAPRSMGDLCRLMIFAFGGRRDLAESLFKGNLRLLPQAIQKFWLATADLAAGGSDDARRQFEQLLSEADPSTRRAIERRLKQSSKVPQPLSAEAGRVLESAALELSHEERFRTQPGRLFKRARATQLLIVVNVVMFAAEMFFGGSYDFDTLYNLGALYPEAVRAGEWWRLFASLFLHYGPFHIAINMTALWLLGPFVESALGSLKFLLVYLLSGLGSMVFVMEVASGPAAYQLTVGASGGVMALVGATAALMLRGWLREKAVAAKKGLLAMAFIAATQTLFDAFVPNVSMTGHLSGAILGFIVTMILSRQIISGHGGCQDKGL